MNLKNKFTKPIVALAALATVGAGAGAAALASADTAVNDTSTQAGVTRPDRAPGVHGKITAISGTTLTITNERSNTTYTVDASAATVMKASAGAAPTTSSVSSLAVGDIVHARGTVSGTSVTATNIMSGMMGGKGFGGRGHGTAGTVTAVSGNTITITGDNGTSYTVDASSAKVSKVVEVSVSDIKVGDRIGAEGSVSGTTVTAQRIMTGLPERPADAPAQQ